MSQPNHKITMLIRFIRIHFVPTKREENKTHKQYIYIYIFAVAGMSVVNLL